jgi:hypothetical protein
MRTTIEMRPEHRAALLAIAARRGQKGFSSVLEEAIASYLNGGEQREERRRTLESLAGSLTHREVNELRDITGQLRESRR